MPVVKILARYETSIPWYINKAIALFLFPLRLRYSKYHIHNKLYAQIEKKKLFKMKFLILNKA